MSVRGGGELKFSGVVNNDGGPTFYLADSAFAFTNTIPLNYPTSIARSLENLATNLLFAVPAGATVTIELLQNGAPVAGFATTYIGPDPGGIKTATIGPVAFAGPPVPDTYDLRVTIVATFLVTGNISATVGVE